MKERRKPECLQRVKVKKLTMQRNGKEEAAQGVVINTTANNDRRPELPANSDTATHTSST